MSVSVLYTFFGILQVVLGLLDPSNYMVLQGEEGIGNGTYDYHAEQCRGMMNLKSIGCNWCRLMNVFLHKHYAKRHGLN